MKRYINCAIVLITFLTLTVIIVVGLDIRCLKFGSFVNAQDINSILINLSYSYISGVIFYLLVTAIPFYLRTKKMKIVIKDGINNISKSTQEIIFAYSPESIGLSNELIENTNLDEYTEEKLRRIFQGSNIFNVSNVVKRVYPGAQTTIQFTARQSFRIIDKAIEEILCCYLDYLSEEQVILLNKIKGSEFRNKISSSVDTIFDRFMFRQPALIESLAEEFIAFWKDVKELNRISE